MTVPIIHVSDLAKTYPSNGVTAVKGVSFDVAEGEIFSLLGPNGAGKSTIISILTGLLKPSSGDARLCGHSIITQPMEVKKNIGVVPQEIALYPIISVRENLVFFGRLYGLGGKQLRLAVDRAIERVNLTEQRKEKVEALSGGMQRRLNIAVGLLNDPRILFMDEPTVGIDPQNRVYILETIKELNKQGMCIFYTSHYMEEVQEISHRIGIIDYGAIVALGTQEDLMRAVDPLHTIRIELESQEKTDNLLADLAAIEDIDEIIQDSSVLRMKTKQPNPVVIAIMGRANQLGIGFSSIKIESPSLESVFLSLTSRQLRD